MDQLCPRVGTAPDAAQSTPAKAATRQYAGSLLDDLGSELEAANALQQSQAELLTASTPPTAGRRLTQAQPSGEARLPSAHARVRRPWDPGQDLPSNNTSSGPQSQSEQPPPITAEDEPHQLDIPLPMGMSGADAMHLLTGTAQAISTTEGEDSSAAEGLQGTVGRVRAKRGRGSRARGQGRNSGTARASRKRPASSTASEFHGTGMVGVTRKLLQGTPVR